IDFFQAILLGATVGVMSVNGMLLTLGGVAVGIAILNYVSLTIAVAARRTREIGIRKALGATALITACEHLVETATSVLVALAIDPRRNRDSHVTMVNLLGWRTNDGGSVSQCARPGRADTNGRPRLFRGIRVQSSCRAHLLARVRI